MTALWAAFCLTIATLAYAQGAASPPRVVTEDSSVKAFRVNVPDAAITDLRPRILATRSLDGIYGLVFALGVVLTPDWRNNMTDVHTAEVTDDAAAAIATAADTSIRPFHVHMSDEALANLRRRILATQC